LALPVRQVPHRRKLVPCPCCEVQSVQPNPEPTGTIRAVPDLDLESIKQALAIAREKGFGHVEIALGNTQFSATLGRLQAPGRNGAAGQPRETESEEPAGPAVEAITAPCVGYFQEGKPKLAVGAKVAQGQVIASISALGIMNDVESPLSGEIVEVLAQAGQAVQFGQPIATVKVEP
jgi:acetyl-CoA carboxylase biotin carboxyl carrier protein